MAGEHSCTLRRSRPSDAPRGARLSIAAALKALSNSVMVAQAPRHGVGRARKPVQSRSVANSGSAGMRDVKALFAAAAAGTQARIGSWNDG